MRQAGSLRAYLLSGLLAVMGGCATSPVGALVTAAGPPPTAPVIAVSPDVVVPLPAPDGQPLPINLPTALQLANARAVDIAAASERIQVAAAVLERARVMWLPTVTLGADYYRHDGPIQDVSNSVFNDSHTTFMVGAGSGIGPAAVLTVDDAIFAPLVARQQVRARQADLQATSNDTLVAVSDAYFTVQQARGELAGAIDATRSTEDLIASTRKLAPAIVPELELFRAETELARRQQAELLARERWKVASAELLRVLHMNPSAQVEPVEPAQLRVELIDLQKPIDELVAIGLSNRPELAAQQAQIQATLASLKQEHWRPLLPNVLLRGAATNPAGTLAGGVFFPTPHGSAAGMRGDVDLEVLWQLDNLGLGNRALVHQREAENHVAVADLARIQDRVAAEVVQAYTQAQMASSRVEVTERGLKFALLSVDRNLAALRQVKGAGNQLVLLVRPQEVVAAIQSLSQAYLDYFGAIADANRAQFRLYRALGQPAECVLHGKPVERSGNSELPASPEHETLPDPQSLPGESKPAGNDVPPQ
jgi:outer membrane protein TolC